MGDLSEHFDRREFACKCGCGMDTVDHELVTALEGVRRRFKAPILITSGCRCEAHNKAIGGASGSQHTRGKAADIVVKDVSPAVVASYVNAISNERWGVGTYSGWVHIDVRPDMARWVE